MVLTNNKDIIEDIETQAGLGRSDHCTLVVTLSCSANKEEEKVRHDFSKADFDKLSQYLNSVDWEEEFKDKDTNAIWNIVKNKIQKATELNVPKIKSKGKKRKRWMDKGTLTTVRKKQGFKV